LDTLYPAHAKALQKAKLAPSRFPKLKEILRKIEINKTEREEKKKILFSWEVYFCIGYIGIWKQTTLFT